MKLFNLFFIFFIFLVGTLAINQVYASCSLGASPLEMQASAKPGQIVEITWSFFNLRGDRPTHVLISQTSGPDWEINYNPKAKNASYDVSGTKQSILENFAMDKSNVVLIKPSGIYVVHPNSTLGYIIIDKQMKILITIPDNAKIGEKQDFVFEALGKCFGETGSVSANIATELKVHITPTTDYYEKPVDDVNSIDLGRQIMNFFTANSQISPVVMISSGITLILVIVLAVLLVIIKRKKVKKAVKEEIKTLKPAKRKKEK